MATLNATRAGAPARTIEKGVFSEVSGYTAAAAQVADKIVFCNVAAGTTVQNIIMTNAALGGSTTLAIGDSVNGNAYWLAATSTAAVASTLSTGLAYTFAVDATIYAILAGAAATGAVQLIVNGTRDTVTLA